MLPAEFIDSHHHFLDPRHNRFQSFLGSLLGGSQQAIAYLPEHYEQDVVEPLRAAGVKLLASVHVECLPDGDGYDEAHWIESLIEESKTNKCTIGAIVASCNLANPNASVYLDRLATNCPNVRGIRWILDYVGKFGDANHKATHVATSRHPVGKEDYLRYNNNNNDDDQTLPEFEMGYSLLEKYNYSFDLQCAPEQLPAAAALVAKYPNIRVCIDHIGKPRTLLGPDEAKTTATKLNDKEYECWKTGMKLMSQLPNVYVKISMLGYAVPGWIRSTLDNCSQEQCPKYQLIKQIIYDVIEMFGPDRCMIGLNWWKDGAMSDADGLSLVGPTPLQLLECISDILSKKYKPDDCHKMFVTTAQQFYRIKN